MSGERDPLNVELDRLRVENRELREKGATSKSWTEAVDDVRRDWRALLRSILQALGIFRR